MRLCGLRQNTFLHGVSHAGRPGLQRARGLIATDHVYIERSEIEETGSYDLEGLFIRLGSAIDSVGAKRVVLDTIEALFSGLSNAAIIRAELRRLFHWLKERGVTAIVTGESGEKMLTRYGLEEYVALAIEITETNSEIITGRMQVLIDTRNNQENRRYKLSISVGYSYYDPENPCSIDDLIERADKLMYEQKQNKKRLLPQTVPLQSES